MTNGKLFVLVYMYLFKTECNDIIGDIYVHTRPAITQGGSDEAPYSYIHITHIHSLVISYKNSLCISLNLLEYQVLWK